MYLQTYERRAIFKHHMDRTIEAALQMGLIIKWLDLDKEFIWKERELWERKNNKTAVYYSREAGAKKLVLGQFAGLYLMCFAGLMVAMGAFYGEKWIVRRRQQREGLVKEWVVDNRFGRKNKNIEKNVNVDTGNQKWIVVSRALEFSVVNFRIKG